MAMQKIPHKGVVISCIGLITIIVAVVCLILFKYATTKYPADYRIKRVGIERVYLENSSFPDFDFYQISIEVSPVHYKHLLRAGSIPPYSDGCAEAIMDVFISTDSVNAGHVDLGKIKPENKRSISAFEVYDNKTRTNFTITYYDDSLHIVRMLQQGHDIWRPQRICAPFLIAVRRDAPAPKRLVVKMYDRDICGEIVNSTTKRYNLKNVLLQ